MSAGKKIVGVLASGRGSNLQALLGVKDAPFEIKVVISNNPGAQALDRAKAAGAEPITIDHRPFKKDREAFEREVTKALEAHDVDIVALAGFMRVLTPYFVRRWQGRLINIHPSLLPLFPGLDTHARALAAGMRVHGCTVHYVNEDVDSGAIIGQAVVPVLPGDDPDKLAARVLTAEHKLYPQCLSLVARGDGAFTDGTMLISAS